MIHDDGRLEPGDPLDTKGKTSSMGQEEEEEMGIIEKAVLLLEGTEDTECQQTFIRALR